jgi:hypothetical protein
LPSAFKRTGFCPAGYAPGSPKVKKDNFAVKVLEPDHLAVEKRQSERKGWHAKQRRLDIARVTGKAVRQKRDDSCHDKSHKSESNPRYQNHRIPVLYRE